MKIKILMLFIVLVIVACSPKNNEKDFEVDEFGSIISYKGNSTSIIIPQNIGNTQVTAIGNRVFKGKNITSVTLPESITLIGFEAFANNRLNNITIGSDVILGLRAELEFHFVFEEDFDNFYNNNYMKGGTYIKENGQWNMIEK